MKILVSPTSFPTRPEDPSLVRLSAFAAEIVWNPYGRPMTPGEALPLLAGVDGWIAGVDDISADLLLQAPPSLKAISRYGVGVERVDLEAAKARGIAVSNTPGANTESVADLAFGLMLSAARRIPMLDRQMKADAWPRYIGTELFGKTLGIVGLGAIGKAVARRATGFSMRVLAHDPYLNTAWCTDHGIEAVSLQTLLAASDVVTLHVPLTPATTHMIDAAAIARMKSGAILINTARGGLVEETALLAALRDGRLAAAGLDAFEQEPPAGNPLLSFDQVVTTPHAGSHTREAAACMAAHAVDNLIALLTAAPCPSRIV